MLSPVNVKIQKLAHYFFYVTKIYKKKEKENSVHLLSRMFSIFVELKNSTEWLSTHSHLIQDTLLKN